MALATASNVIWGQSLKLHFMPIWELAQLVQSFDIFLKVFISGQQYLGLNETSWMALLDSFVFDFASSLKRLKFNISWTNTQIGTKCDFRDWPRITFETAADAMFA